MPKVATEDIDALNAVLTVTISKEDYEPKFNKELSKIKDKASFKGFRQGKVPTSFLKKMYGKGLLSEIVTDLLQKEVSEVIASTEENLVGNPILAEGQPPFDIDINRMQDYVFTFDIGKAPEFEVKGVDSNYEYEVYKIELPRENVLEQLDAIRKRKGIRQETDEIIQEDDMIVLNAVELDGDHPKADGWKTTFSVLVQQLTDGPVKEDLLTKKKGDTFRFNIYELEQGASRERVKKYLLNFTPADIEEGTETGEMYEATIASVNRQSPAELNQEFFNQVFPEGMVTTEEEAINMLAENMAAGFQGQVDSLLYRDMHTRLIELNRDAMPLPNDFLKRWLKTSHEEEADKILENFDSFLEDMRWNLIKNKLIRQFTINVSQDEVRDLAYHRIASYFGGYYQEDLLEPIVKRMMEDKEQFNGLVNDLVNNKLLRNFKTSVTLKEVSIAENDFIEKYKSVMEEEEAKAKSLAKNTASNEEE